MEREIAFRHFVRDRLGLSAAADQALELGMPGHAREIRDYLVGDDRGFSDGNGYGYGNGNGYGDGYGYGYGDGNGYGDGYGYGNGYGDGDGYGNGDDGH